MVTRALSVAIIGAGIGGLTAAASLRRAGIEVAVYEQAAKFTRLGAGIQQTPNSVMVLRKLGLEDRLRDAGYQPSVMHYRDSVTGDILWEKAQGAKAEEKFGAPHLLLHRGDLLGILAEAVMQMKPDAVTLNKRCVAVSQTADNAEARFADGHVVRSAFVVGADGIHSKVRECLFGPGRAEFTGCVAWRGLVPMASLPPHLARMVGTNWLGPQGHVLHYPVRRGELMNYISIVERDDWQQESWTIEGSKGELANDFRGWHADVHTLIEGLDTPYKWALFVRGPMPHWTQQRITLLGDACHPTLPFLGQGAVMAIEDAYVVAACVHKYADEPAVALTRYEDIRRERTAAVVRKAHENRRQVFSPALADENAVASEVTRDWQQVRLRERMDWLYTYDATAVEI
jgi:salicylate hydroxylase